MVIHSGHQPTTRDCSLLVVGVLRSILPNAQYRTREYLPEREVRRARHLWRLALEFRPLSCDGHPAKCNIGGQWKDLDVPTVTAAGPPSSFPDQTLAPSVLCRTRAKSSHQCRRQSAATRLSLLPAQRGVPTPRHDAHPTPRNPSRNFRSFPPAYHP